MVMFHIFVVRLPEGTQKRYAASQDAQEVGRSGGVGQTGVNRRFQQQHFREI